MVVILFVLIVSVEFLLKVWLFGSVSSVLSFNSVDSFFFSLSDVFDISLLLPFLYFTYDIKIEINALLFYSFVYIYIQGGPHY